MIKRGTAEKLIESTLKIASDPNKRASRFAKEMEEFSLGTTLRTEIYTSEGELSQGINMNAYMAQ